MYEDKNEDVDPNGVGQHDAGAKLDAGKPRPSLVLGGFSRALMDVTEVGTFGANKYSDNGWKEVDKGEQRYFDAAMRHIMADMRGETLDPESNLPHLAHATWNLLAVVEFRNKATLKVIYE